MKVYGLDLSLSATGLVDVASETTMILKPPKALRGHERLRWIRDQVLTHTAQIGLLVVEGPSYNSKGGGQHERAGLWWFVTEVFQDAGIAVAVAPPAVLKKYATGTGNANKDKVVVATARHFAWFDGGNDEADALWLSAIGYDLLSMPVARMPARNREVLENVEWL